MKRKITLMALIIVSLLIMQLPIAVFADDSIETMPGVSSDIKTLYEDNAPAVWVGGNFIADPYSAETEGLTVIQGNMIVQSNNLFGVGVVGVGTGIVPTPKSVMLAVGEDLIVASSSSMKIGAPLINVGIISAIALIGGEVSGDVKAVCFDGTEDTSNIFDGLGELAIAHWSNFENELKEESDNLAQMANTGTVATVTSIYDPVVFTCTNPSAPLQVFEINADLFNSLTNGEFQFNLIPKLESGLFTPIVVNVIGEDVTLLQKDVRINGVRVDDLAQPKDFGNGASAILWNFVDAKTLNITGSSQVMGTIIAPYTETVNITAHTNGRLFVNGDLTRSGTGTEHHNYPWTGGEWYFASSPDPLWGAPDPDDPEESDDPEEPEELAEPGDPEELEEVGDPESSEELEEVGDSESLEELEEVGDSESSEELEEVGDSESLEELEESDILGVPVGPDDSDDPVDTGDPVDSRAGHSAGSVVTDDPDDPDDPDEPNDSRTEYHTGSIVTDGTYGSDNPVDSRADNPTGRSAIDNPDDPDDLEELGDIDEPTTGYHIPNTGDNSSFTRWLIVMCCSAVICIPCFLFSRKSNSSSSYTK